MAKWNVSRFAIRLVFAAEHRTACRAKPNCAGEAEEGAVGVDRALETGNSAIYAEYIREMALPKGWALKSPSASRSDRMIKGSMGEVTISSGAARPRIQSG
jgi:hypothetical protein